MLIALIYHESGLTEIVFVWLLFGIFFNVSGFTKNMRLQEAIKIFNMALTFSCNTVLVFQEDEYSRDFGHYAANIRQQASLKSCHLLLV